MLTAILHAALALASPNGKIGVAAAGCTCHDTRESSQTEVTLTADTTSVEVGDVVNLTLIVEHATAKAAGLDVAAKGGTFVAGDNNRISRNEVTHSEPTEMVDGAVTYTFSWTAETGGSFKIYGAGLAANGDEEDHGDDWAFADSVTIEVADADTDVDQDTDTDDTGGGDVPPCGCTAGDPPLGLAPLIMGLAALRRRAR